MDRINKEIASIQVNQWKNSSAVIKSFRNIENKRNCSLIIFDIQDFHPSISLVLFNRTTEFGKEMYNLSMMKFPSSYNQGKHYYSVMLTRMILMYNDLRWSRGVQVSWHIFAKPTDDGHCKT